MADYKSMYYELLKATERAITSLSDANRAARAISKDDCLEALNYLIRQNFYISDTLRKSELRSEDIYIETCEPDPELDAQIDAFLASPFDIPK